MRWIFTESIFSKLEKSMTQSTDWQVRLPWNGDSSTGITQQTEKIEVKVKECVTMGERKAWRTYVWSSPIYDGIWLKECLWGVSLT